MVFRKYKPVTQWGKQDTRIFKAILNARNQRKMPIFRIPDALEPLGVTVHDPTKPGFFESDQVKSAERAHGRGLQAKDDIKSHPLYNEIPCRLFDGAQPMSDGIAQACLIANAVLRTELPDEVMTRAPENVEEDKIRDAIMHGERYDPTLEKLPKRFDPVLFWVNHPRVHGTPVVKRGNIILDNLFRQILLNAVHSGKLKATQMKLDRDEPLSACVHSAPYFTQSPLVVRGQPHLTLQCTTMNGDQWTKDDELGEIHSTSIPSISPLSPLIDFSSDHIYNTDGLVARPLDSSRLQMHTIAWTREQNQKYPWTTEQNAANAILYTFGAAVAEATKRGDERDLSRSPVMTRGMQLVDGRLDMVTVQLNTLDLSEKAERRNVVWLQRAVRLYKPLPYYEQLQKVEELNIDAYKKMAAILLS